MDRYSKASYFLILLIGILLFSTCKKDSSIDSPYPGVDQALWPFFRNFENDALGHGITVDLKSSGITGTIQEIDQNYVAGVCTHVQGQPRNITIDKTYFNSHSYYWQELVIYHELGHCVLGRSHRDEADQFGFCKSIMRSGLGNCIDHYSLATRPDYMNELFDPQFF